MNPSEILNQAYLGLKALDRQRQIALALGVAVTLALVILLSFQATKPQTAALYNNLSREDLNNMSRILSENGIAFKINQEDSSIQVKVGTTSQARMLLAEHGLPSTEKSGYELFDQINTLGLTSFMQGVTNKRAIEGELIRTIQMIDGVNSARVHLVLEDRNVFRRSATQNSSASVVLKTYGKLPGKSVSAIRHMVASAVPGLSTGDVTIIGADGSLLTTKDDILGGSTKLVEMEREYARDIEEKILLALGAHIGADNMRVSAAIKLNSDQRRIDEVIYDPNSKTERSVQVVREAGTAENTESSRAVTIDQNLPEEELTSGGGNSSSENSERREELTNYEINQKKISLVSDGYMIENLSVAVLVNSARIGELLGTNADQTALDDKVRQLQEIVEASVSIDKDRGDNITIRLVEFIPKEETREEGGNVFVEFLALHLGSILNGAGIIGAALLFALLGVRPILAFLNSQPEPGSQPVAALPGGSAEIPRIGEGELENNSSVSQLQQLPGDDGGSGNMNLSTEPASPVSTQPKQNDTNAGIEKMEQNQEHIRGQLAQMISQSEERTAFAIKQLMREEAAAN